MCVTRPPSKRLPLGRSTTPGYRVGAERSTTRTRVARLARAARSLTICPAVPLDTPASVVDLLHRLGESDARLAIRTRALELVGLARRLHLLQFIGPPPDEVLRTLGLGSLGVRRSRRRRARRRVRDLRAWARDHPYTPRGAGGQRRRARGRGVRAMECLPETTTARRNYPFGYLRNRPSAKPVENLRQGGGRRHRKRPMGCRMPPPCSAAMSYAATLQRGDVVCRHPERQTGTWSRNAPKGGPDGPALRLPLVHQPGSKRLMEAFASSR